MVYGQWSYVRPGLSQPRDFGSSDNRLFYVRKHPNLEFDGRCFWNGTDREQKMVYWVATEGEDWEQVEKDVDAGNYWVVREYQIIGERTKEAKEKKIDSFSNPMGTWTTASAPGAYSPNRWEDMWVATSSSTSAYINTAEWAQGQFNEFLRLRPMPATNEIQCMVIEALHQSNWREAVDRLVPNYITSWEINRAPFGIRELWCDGVDGQTHGFNLDILGVEA